jgi:hypothetical protein
MRRIRLELLANSGDKDPQVVGIVLTPRTPDRFKDLLAQDKMARPAKENLNYLKLDPGEEDLVAIGMKDSTSCDVNREVSRHEGC